MWNKIKTLAKRAVGHKDGDPETVTAADWVRSLSTNPKQDVVDYFTSLFPIAGWIGRYNLGWLSRDVVAGITVGIVLVPQSMSYAQIATLPSQYGLYSAFVGVIIYCFFATSKDVSIGPVAVMSLTVSQIIKAVNNSHPGVYEGHVIATTVAFLCGFIVLGLGLLRIGWLVEFIPAPAVTGFMTGSAINIVAGQLPGLFGLTGFDTRAASYKVIINTLKHLPKTKLDAAFGVPALVSLYAMRILFDKLSKRYPQHARKFFFISIMRNGFVLIVLTLASFLLNRDKKASGKFPIRILEDVPRGFQGFGVPDINSNLVKILAGQLPVATIILLLEHIAISKSFGRVNGYKIDPNQELIAIGVTNTIGTFFSAYPSTGSFSRSALNSKCGVRTPLAGWFTGVVVIVALYGLTPAFFWIPTAALSAIIIHAVADLVAAPSQAYAFWRVSPFEFIIFIATVATTVFATIEEGVYVSVIASLVLLLIRVARPRGSFLGRTVTYSSQGASRDIYVPFKQGATIGGSSRPQVEPPLPGVFVYRYEESLLYPNCSLMNSNIVDYVKENTRRGKDMSDVAASDRPWNDPGPRRGKDRVSEANETAKPLLRAIVLDFSSISHIDTTGVQALVDARTEVERWADGHVEFHFANILSPWIARALVASGFGRGLAADEFPPEVAPVMNYGDLQGEVQERVLSPAQSIDEESAIKRQDASVSVSRTGSYMGNKHKSLYGSTDVSVHEVDQTSVELGSIPFFHADLESAVRAAESRAAARNGPNAMAVTPSD